MKKLTELQIENLIETIVRKNKNNEFEHLRKTYIRKWNLCENKQERFKFFDELFLHRKKMIKEGYSQSSIDEGWITDLFKGGTKGFVSTAKEWFVRKVVGFLGVKDPGLQNAIAIGLANLDWTEDWTKLMSPIKNCNYFADVIVDSVIEYYIDKKMDEWVGSGTLGSALRNAISDALTDETHVQKIQDAITGVLCSALQKAFGGGLGSVVGNIFGGGSTGAAPAAATT